MVYPLIRMDADYSARKNAQTYFGIKDPDYYEFESKILSFTKIFLQKSSSLVRKGF